ncbi:3'-5' exoribonuclease YhaM family protein [Lentilactobacillus hilgardii]|jgi:3'-5' exoribonuclease|uniref:HD domain-containing protein n=2 Tax=Lentilactobacillus hilgardii TaxID=1588 RepID=A0A6P1EBW7_LENHI|nr:OB-fold nucleic acid binding domain-containing protein [Lentilactobacillus hilgardii]RRG11910.1 MAG: HD domain-containing protein [Lactobacillus sp.]EEI70269.1 nucleic acid-binding domain protein [Lentilactobacillus hilgardii ATCC 27305]MCT3391630.1 HD domain-containing protein [Lentilactobacillus hilgardii]MCV3740494.1 OB-fold nucleic acid binding domain-containing protein [Lentilactobacillus hilgardii]QHB52253.1 HD domain-containing protein [Lentilactobacillus hilgardii]
MAKHLMDFSLEEDFETYVLIKNADKRVAKNGKSFLSITFQDQSGQIAGMYWDASEQDAQQFVPGRVVYLKGKRENYKDTPQIKIYEMRLTKANEPHDPLMFVKRAPMTSQEMKDYINQTIFEITNATYNRIVRALLNRHAKSFFSYPAAKSNHHDFAGGLAFHTISILRLAHSVVKQYPDIDAPLLYAGAVLHDLGKTVELSGPVGTEYTLAGNLLGHLSIIDAEIVEAADKLGIDGQNEDLLLLRHMVLSHHGLLEYGSPERPKLLEAEILHDLDELDASIMMIQGALTNIVPGDYSDRIFGLDNRRFYKPHTPNHLQDSGKDPSSLF